MLLFTLPAKCHSAEANFTYRTCNTLRISNPPKPEAVVDVSDCLSVCEQGLSLYASTNRILFYCYLKYITITKYK